MSGPWIEFSAVDASGKAGAHADYLERMVEVARPVREAGFGRLRIGPGSTVLDAGCGLGEVAIGLASQVAPGGWVAGIDLSREMIDRARLRADAKAAAVDFRVASITEIPFPDGTFDIARSERVFQHLDTKDRLAAAAEMLRVVVPGGAVQLIDGNHRQWAMAATDLELAQLAVDFVATHTRLPEAGILNSGLLGAIGAVDIDVTLVPMTFDKVAALFEMLALQGWMDGLIHAQTVTPERAAAFFSDLATREREGLFLAVGIAYITTGRKPG